MPSVSGGTRRRATAASARAVSSGSVKAAAPCISSNSRFETVTALPPRPSTNGAMHSTCTCPTPRVSATGSGANACAQSTCPSDRWSRRLAHDGSLTSARSSPASAAKPCSRAATSTAQSTSGTKAATMRSVMLAPRAQQSGSRDERARELGDLAVLERRLRLLQLALEAIERVEAADRHVEDRPDALLAQPVDDVGRNAGVDGGLHGRAVGFVDEHRDRPPREPGHLEH